MSAQTQFQAGVTTLVNQATCNAEVARAQIIAAQTNQLGNSRLGIVLATAAVADVAKPMIIELVRLYSNTLQQSPKTGRPQLKQAAQDGLSYFLSATKDFAKTSPAFIDGLREGAFKAEMARQSERLRASLALELSYAEPVSRSWAKALKEDHPIFYDAGLVGVGAALIAALAEALVRAKLFHHSG